MKVKSLCEIQTAVGEFGNSDTTFGGPLPAVRKMVKLANPIDGRLVWDKNELDLTTIPPLEKKD
jgi:hypothetical protein